MEDKGHHEKSMGIEEYANCHPYEYLTKLNEIYANYNKSTAKDYSLASSIKLPFMRFNTIKVPECFENNYAIEKRQLTHHSIADDTNHKVDDFQKKMWREHRDIIKRYVKERVSSKKAKERPLTAFKKNNKQLVDKVLAKDKNNLFLKKIIEKGTKFQYDEKKLETQVIHKLKNLNKKNVKNPIRSQTANISSEKQSNDKENMQFLQNSCKIPKKQTINVKPDEFLQFSKEEDMIIKYKSIIKNVDCSISEKNIQKTCKLLDQMKQIIQEKQY